MKIVVLDGQALNPGDLDWAPLSFFGDIVVHERTSPDDVIERAATAEIILTNKTPLTKELLGQLPALRYIGVLATGYNIVDIAAAGERGITVTNVPAYGVRSVAQHVLALLLELTQGVGHHAQAVKEGRWASSPEWCFWDQPLVELDGLVLGIIGYGEIGKAVAQLGQAFGMQVIVHSRRSTPGVMDVSRAELFARSDVIALHCPLTPETTGIVNRRSLGLVKPSAFLINTARGGLVVENDLAEALNSGRLAGAAVDVLSTEPPSPSNPLIAAKNCIVTPHLAWATRAARQRLLTSAAMNIGSYLRGAPSNVVS